MHINSEQHSSWDKGYAFKILMVITSFPPEGHLLLYIYKYESASSLTISRDTGADFLIFEDLFRSYAANSGHPFRKDCCLERMDNK